MEALLAARTVYGKHSDVEHLIEDAKFLLQESMDTFDNVLLLVGRIRSAICDLKTYKVCYQILPYIAEPRPICCNRPEFLRPNEDSTRLLAKSPDHYHHSRHTSRLAPPTYDAPVEWTPGRRRYSRISIPKATSRRRSRFLR